MIESITATVPVSGQPYTDLRPTITAGSIEEYREQLAEVGRLAGNDAFVQRMSQNKSGMTRIMTEWGDLYFNPKAHSYEDADGNKFMTGSTWAALFEVPFNAEKIAPKTAEKYLMTAEQVLEGWDMKGEVSLLYGSTVHKALECAIKYGELGIPNSPHLAMLVRDYLDMTRNDNQASEVFVVDMDEKLCGTIDVLVNKGNKHVVIRDFKTGDIFKRARLTPEAKELFPDLDDKVSSIYNLQLSFYAHILTHLGYKVDGLEIWYIDNEAWKVVSIPILNIRQALERTLGGN